MKESEFGKGFVYPLTLFALHFERKGIDDRCRGMDKEWDKKMIEIYGSKEKWESQQIELFFNRASDHLYELEIPKQFRRKKLGRLAKKLQDKGLKIGHGFMSEKVWTKDDFKECYSWLKEIMFLLDKELGNKPIKATYE